MGVPAPPECSVRARHGLHLLSMLHNYVWTTCDAIASATRPVLAVAMVGRSGLLLRGVGRMAMVESKLARRLAPMSRLAPSRSSLTATRQPDFTHADMALRRRVPAQRRHVGPTVPLPSAPFETFALGAESRLALRQCRCDCGYPLQRPALQHGSPPCWNYRSPLSPTRHVLPAHQQTPYRNRFAPRCIVTAPGLPFPQTLPILMCMPAYVPSCERRASKQQSRLFRFVSLPVRLSALSCSPHL